MCGVSQPKLLILQKFNPGWGRWRSYQKATSNYSKNPKTPQKTTTNIQQHQTTTIEILGCCISNTRNGPKEHVNHVPHLPSTQRNPRAPPSFPITMDASQVWDVICKKKRISDVSSNKTGTLGNFESKDNEIVKKKIFRKIRNQHHLQASLDR